MSDFFDLLGLDVADCVEHEEDEHIFHHRHYNEDREMADSNSSTSQALFPHTLPSQNNRRKLAREVFKEMCRKHGIESPAAEKHRKPTIEEVDDTCSEETEHHQAKRKHFSDDTPSETDFEEVTRVPKLVSISLIELSALVDILTTSCVFRDIPGEPMQLQLIQTLVAIIRMCVQGIIKWAEKQPLHELCSDKDRKLADDAYTRMFAYFLQTYRYATLLRDTGEGLLMLRELVLWATAYTRQVLEAFVPERVWRYTHSTTLLQFPPALMYLQTVYDKPIACLDACETMSTLYSLYVCSSTAVFSTEMQQLFYHVIFRAFRLITHEYPPAIMNIMGGSAPGFDDPARKRAATEIVSDVSILLREMTMKYDVFFHFDSVIHTHEIPESRHILLSEFSMMLFWILNNASSDEGSPLRTYYVAMQLRVGEIEFYRRCFSARAVDDPNFVLGTFRGEEFVRIQEDALRSPYKMITSFQGSRPDEAALLLGCYHTLSSHFVGVYPDLTKRIGSAIILENQLEESIENINDAIHPVLVQVFNHMQLMTENRMLYMYNNVICAMVAWFREIYARHKYSLCGVDIQFNTVNKIFDRTAWLKGMRVSPRHIDLRNILLARTGGMVIRDWDPFEYAAPPQTFPYTRYPDNLIFRPDPEPIPITNSRVATTMQSLNSRLNRISAFEEDAL